MPKFTPGPWIIKHDFNVFKGNRSIAACGGYASNMEDVTPENIANARLIAKAPEMYEMLRGIFRETLDDEIAELLMEIDGD